MCLLFQVSLGRHFLLRFTKEAIEETLSCSSRKFYCHKEAMIGNYEVLKWSVRHWHYIEPRCMEIRPLEQTLLCIILVRT